jgi:DNA-binding NtrC family response regulator
VSDQTKRRKVSGMPLKEIRVELVAGPDSLPPLASVDRISIGSAPGNDLVLSDPMVSRYHCELSREGSRIAIIDLGSTNGTAVGPTRFVDGRVTVSCPTVVSVGDTQLKLADGSVVMVDVPGLDDMGGIVGRAAVMRHMMATVLRVAPTDVSVLVLGESGTGQELIARAIHDASKRADGPFVTVDCAAVPPSLFASEIFGHERGAFTSADRLHIGAIERAHGGTLFLDELGELPADTQSNLLGCLERRKITRLGSQVERDVDIRVVAATHRDLRAEVNKGTFRLDLFYRLAVVHLDVPPLRERPEDIIPLIDHFMREAGQTGAADTLFPGDTLAELKRHSWPGNVRELRNVVASTLALGHPSKLSLRDGAQEADDDLRDPIGRVLELPYRESRAKLLNQFERRYLATLLERTEGNVRRAAREAKMDRSYLMELLKRHDMR